MKKYKDLGPWLRYMDMLEVNEDKGYLEVLPAKGEAYITQPALFAIAGVGFSTRELGRGVEMQHVMDSVGHTAMRIKAYAGWKSQEGKTFLDRPFALHVVKDTEPHDLLYTLLITRRRVWWKLWRKTDRIEVITYQADKRKDL